MSTSKQTGIVELEARLKLMSPELKSGEYVFCNVEGCYEDYVYSSLDAEGLTAAVAAKLTLIWHQCQRSCNVLLRPYICAYGKSRRSTCSTARVFSLKTMQFHAPRQISL